MKSLGDFDAAAVLYDKFTSFRPTTGVPFTLAGTPALSVYKDNSTTESTAGVTLTVDFDGRTGLNQLAIDTSADGTFYSAGSFFQIVITTGTVDGVSVVGSVIACFTLRKTAALKPTVAGRTFDVSAGGEGGIDWANVGSPTTTVNLSGTTIKTATDVETDTAEIGAAGAGLTALATQASVNTIDGIVDAILLDTAEIGAAGAGLTALASQTSVDDLPTNAELATALTGMSTLNAAGVRSAVGLASADLDTQLGAIKADTAASKEYADNTVCRGTVSGTSPTTTSFTSSAMSPAGVDADQFKGRIILFDTDTVTTALRGQGTDITANTGASNPLFTFTALTTAPQSGDTFSIV